MIPHERLAFESGGFRLPIDVYRPTTPNGVLMALLHGGGWISGAPEDMRDIAQIFANKGYTVAVPAYRLAPLHPFPAAVEDVHEALRFLRGKAEDWGYRTDRIVTLGNSAGGHLSAMCGLDQLDPACRANAVIALCPITDVCDPRDTHLPISWSFLEQFMAVPWEGNEDRYCAASPVRRVGPASPPFLIVHGDADDIVPVDQAHRLHEALQTHGVDSELIVMADEGHAFTYAAWTEIEAAIDRFLNRTLGVSAPHA